METTAALLTLRRRLTHRLPAPPVRPVLGLALFGAAAAFVVFGTYCTLLALA